MGGRVLRAEIEGQVLNGLFFDVGFGVVFCVPVSWLPNSVLICAQEA